MSFLGLCGQSSGVSNPLTGFDRQRCPERDDGDKGDFQHWVSSLCIQGRLKGCHCGSLT